MSGDNRVLMWFKDLVLSCYYAFMVLNFFLMFFCSDFNQEGCASALWVLGYKIIISCKEKSVTSVFDMRNRGTSSQLEAPTHNMAQNLLSRPKSLSRRNISDIMGPMLRSVYSIDRSSFISEYIPNLIEALKLFVDFGNKPFQFHVESHRCDTQVSLGTSYTL